MSQTPLTRTALDNASCQKPGCDNHASHSRFHLHARCHMNRGLSLSYLNGILFVACAVCNSPVASIEVAP